MQKKSSKTKKIYIILLSLCLLFCIIPSALSLTETADPFRSLITTVSYPLTYPLGRVGQLLSDAIYGSVNEQALRDQLAQAKEELAALRERLSDYEAIKRENSELRAYLWLAEEHKALQIKEADIVYRGDASGKTVILSRGSAHGIRVGMPVLCSGGLYGTVSEVQLTTCKVTTLREETVYISATDARSGINGTLCGLQAGQSLALFQYLDTHTDAIRDLAEGDIIVTSGYGERYPAGLPIGVITRVEVDPYDRSPRAYIQLYADYTTPATLMIVTGVTEGEGGEAE